MLIITARGRALYEAVFACLRGLHAEWSAQVGAERFATTCAVLRELAPAS